MKEFWIAIAIIGIIFLFSFLCGSMKNSGDLSRQEEREQYLRWVEEHEKN